jgi:hypothetical protein
MSELTDECARSALFRAFLNDEPRPTPDEFRAVKWHLGGDPAFCAALDQVVSIIVSKKVQENQPVNDEVRSRLQAYVAAQLEGRAIGREYADLQHQLDANVPLAEEYAILYETIQAEQLGQIPTPSETPGADLTFLDAPRSARANWLSVRAPHPWSTPRLAPALVLALLLLALSASGLLLTLRRLPQDGLIVAAFLTAALTSFVLVALTGFWQMRRARSAASEPFKFASFWQFLLLLTWGLTFGGGFWMVKPQLNDWPPPKAEIIARPAAFRPNSNFQFHLNLEAQLPTQLAVYQPKSVPRRSQPCIDYDHGLLIKSVCTISVLIAH